MCGVCCCDEVCTVYTYIGNEMNYP